MDFNKQTPRAERTIGGVKVSVVQPYAEGQTITAAEASMLNQTLAENLSNNCRKAVQEFVPEGAKEGTKPRVASAEEAQALVDAYTADYTPGVRTGGGGGRSLSPVEKEMRNIALQKVREILSKQGIKQNTVNLTELRDQLIEKNEKPLRAAAEKIVAARENNGADGLDVAGLVSTAKAEGESKAS